MKFQRKMEIVEAIQFRRGNKREVKAFAEGNAENNPNNRDGLFLSSGFSRLCLWPGDWIIRHDDGTFGGYRNTEFSAIYEPLEEVSNA